LGNETDKKSTLWVYDISARGRNEQKGLNSNVEYLKIKRAKSQVRADGSRYAVPLLVTKIKKYGEVVSEQTISRTKPIMVTGAHDSGKTRWLTRLHERADEIWGAKIKADSIFLDTLSPLQAWFDNPALGKWWDEEQKALPLDERQPWKKLKQYERSEALPEYFKATGAVLFIDDAHKLVGRKLQLARRCAMATRITVVAASEEQRLPPNLRPVLLRRDPQIFRLDSEVAYDATHILMWILLACALVIGWWEAAVVIGGLKALGSGRRASRAD